VLLRFSSMSCYNFGMTKSQLRQTYSLSEAVEDYLKAIYLIRETSLSSGNELPRVTTTELADHLGVAPASVTGMIKKLAELGLIEHAPYHGVILTSTGEHIALELVRHHRLIELYLTHIMGFTWDEVHDQADALEHVISEELEDRLAGLLGDPTYDPHGDPIPTKGGVLPDVAARPLSEQEPSIVQRLVISRVLTQDPDRLRYLADLHLIPGTCIRFVSRAPFGGPLSLQRKEDDETGAQCILSPEIASLLLTTVSSGNGRSGDHST
jgi:DtxR family transcriptional regulator, Mn-dependent transcriptional regulator